MSSTQTVIKIQGNSYNLGELYGKTFYANKDLKAFTTYAGTKVLKNIKKGELIGRLQTFIVKGHKNIAKDNYLIFGDNTKAVSFAVPYNENNFSERELTEQGAKTTKEIIKIIEKEKAEEEKPFLQSTTETIINTLLPYVLFAFVLFLIYKFLLKNV